MRIRREGNCRNKLSRSRRPRDAARSVSLKCVGDGDGTARSIARAAYVVVLRSTVLDSHWPGRVRARATGTVLLSGPRRPPRLSTLELLVAGYKCRVHHHHHPARRAPRRPFLSTPWISVVSVRLRSPSIMFATASICFSVPS